MGYWGTVSGVRWEDIGASRSWEHQAVRCVSCVCVCPAHLPDVRVCSPAPPAPGPAAPVPVPMPVKALPRRDSPGPPPRRRICGRGPAGRAGEALAFQWHGRESRQLRMQIRGSRVLRRLGDYALTCKSPGWREGQRTRERTESCERVPRLYASHVRPKVLPGLPAAPHPTCTLFAMLPLPAPPLLPRRAREGEVARIRPGVTGRPPYCERVKLGVEVGRRIHEVAGAGQRPVA